MKIIAEKTFKDRKTKKRIEAGTAVTADKKRLELLKKAGINYQVVEEKAEKATQPKKETAKSAKEKETRAEK